MWYYTNNNEQIGPISEDEVKNLIIKGTIIPSTLVWVVGMPTWQTVEQTPLAAYLYQVPPPIQRNPPPIPTNNETDSINQNPLYTIIEGQCPNCGSCKTKNIHGITFIDIYLCLVGIGIIIVIVKLATKPKDGSKEYECILCGYRWRFKPGSAYPKINIRPELMYKGEQLLREEEERRKRSRYYD